MPALILDSSVALSLAFEDEFDEYSSHVFETIRQHGALVPQLWFLEVANILSSGVKRSRITDSDARRFLSLLAAQPIQAFEEKSPGAAEEYYTLSRRFLLTAYDAAYLRLALSSGLPLASKDKALNHAAKAAGIVLFT